APSIAIAGDGISPAASNGAGAFTVSASTDPATPRTVTLTGAGFVTRQTYLRIPGPDALVSLIPASLDLRAFDEMFRTSMLLRWTTAPPLRIQLRTLQFTSINDTALSSLSEQMSEDEATALIADLTWALPQLTGGRFT